VRRGRSGRTAGCNDIEGNLGLALSHPLYHIIGIGVKYIRLGEFAYRINLISAVAAAFTIANLFLLLRFWLDRILPAVIAAATLALSHTFWRHAVIAETYTLYTALLLAELLMLLQYLKTKRTVFLYLLGLFNGLAIANHMFAVIALVCYLVFLIVLLTRRQIRLGQFGIIVVLWIIGAAPYGYLIGKNIIQSGKGNSELSLYCGLSVQLHTDILSAKILFRAAVLQLPRPQRFLAKAGRGMFLT
jgi:4-amino-4-deoxy-L-arabinose transferase-like glycosyltransferase